MKEFIKCMNCWRVFDTWQIIYWPYSGCKCGSLKFKGNCPISFFNLRRFLTDPKYVFLGEKAYEQKS